MCLEQNIKGLCERYGLDFQEFLKEFDLEHVHEMSIHDLEILAEEYELDVEALLFRPIFGVGHLKKKLQSLKLLILDVDGVMTDGGMYYTEQGDQFKKFNTKDGMGIFQMKEAGLEIGIISSGFVGEAIRKRAEILGIEKCYIGRDKKRAVLEKWMEEDGLSWSEIGIIGDDINDLPVMEEAGFSACPSDAVAEVKSRVDLILQKKGGQGCIREFVSNYYLVEKR
ncbi:MAG: HAD-IIIA family hydrolase [Bacteroidetes bacterium]|nr:MAG: HAD-IIIA family hydrolase [Bacteroidota bacterium]